MNITFNEKNRTFKLDTKNSSYIIAIVDEEGFIGHVYYGKKLPDDDVTYLLRTEENPKVPSVNARERSSFFDFTQMEYPGHGCGDYRESAVIVRDKNNHSIVNFTYEGHEIYKGKKAIKGLPATFGNEDECMTLEIKVKDSVLGLNAVLYYSIFKDLDVVARHVSIENVSNDDIYLTRVMSASFDMDDTGFEMISLSGSWARERHIDIRPIANGITAVSSQRGETSHQEHCFIALTTDGTSQTHGDVYAMNFVYSGNFLAQVHRSQFDSVRMMIGINPEDFEWKLSSGDVFDSPEAILVYSSNGLGDMSRTYHDLYRNHLIRSPYKDKKRPVLINNWEATYFDFDTEKLLSIAREAKKNGIEMLVMDDGWFGHRNDDSNSLGDWYVNEDKIKGGLKYLVDEVNKIGLKFGIWFEPEMISPDSDLFRAHPNWAIQVPDRQMCQSRNQYVLDLSNPEVLDYQYEQVAKILRSANIEYVKWDMNRQISDMGSFYLDTDRQGELFHRFVLAMYEMQERLITEFPELLLENCSGGGARFDPGMLYYSPQIWCSDDTDAVERLLIQEGTELIYPLSAMGAHVSDCPNHTVGRVTKFATRGDVALAGTFGYELDITKISQEDRDMIPQQIKTYHKYNDLVRNGDYYRIASYRENKFFDCYEVVAKDKSEALVTLVQVLNRPNFHTRNIKIPGLDPNKKYDVEGQILMGSTIENAGIIVENLWGDFVSRLIYIREV